jgi:hypothetical protein
MNFLRFSNFCLVAVMLVLFTSCVGLGDEIERPTRPPSVRGWQSVEVGSITVKGEFLLKKGESTNNGRVGLKVTDLYPAKHHLLDSPELPKAKVQFFRIPDQTVICEGVFTRGSNSLTTADLCKNNLEWNVIYIRDVNYDEGWVFLDLR